MVKIHSENTIIALKDSFGDDKFTITKGKRIINNVMDLREDIREEYDTVIISAEVESESSNITYDCSIRVDYDLGTVKMTRCDCEDFQENYYRSHRWGGNGQYICKHIAATMLQYISVKSLTPEEKAEIHRELFLELLQENNDIKETISFDVFIETSNIYSKYVFVNFKIGAKKKYVLKNPSQFIKAKNNGDELAYGKGFIYSSKKYIFNEVDEKIVDFIEQFVDINELLEGNRNNKDLIVSSIRAREFLSSIKDKKIDFRGNKVNIIEEDIPFEFDIKDNNENYIIQMNMNEIIPITNRFDIIFFNNKIHLVSKQQAQTIAKFYMFMNKVENITFKKQDSGEVFSDVLPKLKCIGTGINLDESIKDVIISDLECKFYLDFVKKDIVMDVKLVYGDERFTYFSEGNKSKVIRDIGKEKQVLEMLKNLKFSIKENKIVFSGDDEELYNFLSEGYKEIEKIGEVFYSDKFKEKKIYNTPKINAKVKDRENGYLDFTFNIDDIDPKEYKNIVNAFKSKSKFYKLKDSSFLNLQDKDVSEFLEFLDEMDLVGGNKFKIHKNRSVVLEESVNRNNLKFIKGKEIIEEVSSKIQDVKNKEYELPEDLNATLREYQKTGFVWFKNLSEIGLGGILADEMGLGKTVQTIAFLLSEKGKKTLIVAPTSLVYNWKNEFLKFAPSLRIGIVHGTYKDRLEILNDLDNYDVVLTTYGTLRNDEEHYLDINFDYCIIDEAQSIKNSLAQVTKSVKEINAKVRFALTGTPIENNLLELWSIFDFVMPGYLYTSTVFKKKFIDIENTAEHLQKYIKPFMLRRLKKDVMKELPEKIEKKYYVELTKEQKKIYTSYVQDIKDKMEAKDFEGDKITIFSYLTKLRQLCLDPKILLEDYSGKSAKIDATLEIVKECISNNQKIILFSQFTSVLGSITEVFSKNNIKYSYLDGSTAASKRLDLVEKFNESKEPEVFLISLKAGGTGLNLTTANVVIHFDPWWNPSIEEQATDRAHRIGQKNVVTVYKLISQGTIEERIIQLQEDKKILINNIMSGGYEGSSILSSLSNEELKELFIG